MKKFSREDIGLLESLLDLTQDELHNAMMKYLRRYYKKVKSTKDYVIAWGELPVALVAHMDTVFNHQEKNELYYDERKGVMWAINGAGFDDRAGVFGIIKIIQAGYRPTIIFTRDEEIGGLGAAELVLQIQKPISPIKFIIELDRQGSNDCVFYSCGNNKFIEYIESFGFCEEWGTFSDISIICPKWEIAGVNLSIGYYNEHTRQEILHVSQTLLTIEKVKAILKDAKNAPFFKYVHRKFDITDYYLQKYGINVVPETMEVICQGCGITLNEYDSIPVLAPDGSQIYYCGECLPAGDVDFCPICGEAYETKNYNEVICPICNRSRRKKMDKIS